MVLFLVLLLVVLAVTGVLAFVVKVAVGVMLGLVAVAAIAYLAIRRTVRRALYGPPPPRWRRIRGGSSRIEVLDRRRPDA